MTKWIPVAHLALTLLIVVWNIALASRIAQVRKAPRVFTGITALAAWLLLPALIMAVAGGSAITGRALHWLLQLLWPVTAGLFAIQAIYALVRRFVNPLLGLPIAVYNLMVAFGALLGWLAANGFEMPQPALFYLAAYADALVLVVGAGALTTPLYLLPPITSPAFPAIRPLTASFRGAIAVWAAVWAALIFVALPPGTEAVRSYAPYQQERLSERPRGDFRLGLKIFPDLARPPSVLAARNDMSLVDSTGVDALHVVIVPDAAAGVVLDSVALMLETLRRDGTVLIVSLGYRGKLLPVRTPELDSRARLRAVDRIVRRLQPDILIPAEDPYGTGALAVGLLPVSTWQSYFTDASRLAKRLRPRTKIGISASAFGARDSTLYSWAAASGSPVDVLGFSLYPSHRGARDLDAAIRAADRWMRDTRSSKDHWVFATAGFPVAHGERAHERAVWHVISWATSRPQIKGLVVTSAGDYGTAVGLRAPTGRLRTASFAVRRAAQSLRESAAAGDTVATRAPRDTGVVRDTAAAPAAGT